MKKKERKTAVGATKEKERVGIIFVGVVGAVAATRLRSSFVHIRERERNMVERRKVGIP